MNKIKKIFVAFLIATPLLGFSSEIVWLQITSQMTYQDLNNSITNLPLGRVLYLAMEVSNGKVTKANLKNGTWQYASKQEISKPDTKIKLYFGPDRNYWLQELSLNKLELQWLLNHSQTGFSPISILIKDLNPNVIDYEFELDGVNDEVYISYSNLSEFSGVLQDSNSFEGDLNLIQQQHDLRE